MIKKYQIEITKSAEEDLESIWGYISISNPQSALKFIRKIEIEVKRLETNPNRCPFIPENEITGKNYHHLVFGNYRIIFKIETSKVTILRIINSAKLLETE